MTWIPIVLGEWGQGRNTLMRAWYSRLYAGEDLQGRVLQLWGQELSTPRDVPIGSGGCAYVPPLGPGVPYLSFCGHVLLPDGRGPSNRGSTQVGLYCLSDLAGALEHVGVRRNASTGEWISHRLRDYVGREDLAVIRLAFLPCWQWADD